MTLPRWSGPGRALSEHLKLFAQAALGYNPVVALVDSKQGILQAVVGPAARRPQTDLSKTPLFSAMTQSESGAWTGVTAIDGIERLHAFHRVAGRDMWSTLGFMAAAYYTIGYIASGNTPAGLVIDAVRNRVGASAAARVAGTEKARVSHG